ncbi:MAG: hypothetical protein DMG93_10355 [Acidobacteria bacterium]|nr:MAG: hypothetical protein DMG93_10355 [Acidobacteriota bacterium]
MISTTPSGDGFSGMGWFSRKNWIISSEAHHVGSSPPENCSGTAGKVGEGEGESKEGCLIPNCK